MSVLSHDSNGHTIQCFAPYENKENITVLDTASEDILAFLLPSSAGVQINGEGPSITYPAGIYAVHPGVSSITFSSTTNVAIMK